MVGKCSVWLDSYEREETFVVNLFFLGGWWCVELGHSTSLLFMYQVLHVCTHILFTLKSWVCGVNKCATNNTCTLMHFQERLNLSRCCRECKSRSVYFCRPAATQVTFPYGEEELPLCGSVDIVNQANNCSFSSIKQYIIIGAFHSSDSGKQKVIIQITAAVPNTWMSVQMRTTYSLNKD